MGMSKRVLQTLRQGMAALAGCVTLGVAAAPAASLAATTVVQPSIAAAAACVVGNWQVGQSSGMPAVRYQTTHFAFRWNGWVVADSAAINAGTYLESVWQDFVLNRAFPEPYCQTATKYKVNIHIDASFGLSGGVDGSGFMGMWIGPGGLADRLGLAHELTHGLQGSTGGLRDS